MAFLRLLEQACRQMTAGELAATKAALLLLVVEWQQQMSQRPATEDSERLPAIFGTCIEMLCHMLNSSLSTAHRNFACEILLICIPEPAHKAFLAAYTTSSAVCLALFRHFNAIVSGAQVRCTAAWRQVRAPFLMLHEAKALSTVLDIFLHANLHPFWKPEQQRAICILFFRIALDDQKRYTFGLVKKALRALPTMLQRCSIAFATAQSPLENGVLLLTLANKFAQINAAHAGCGCDDDAASMNALLTRLQTSPIAFAAAQSPIHNGVLLLTLVRKLAWFNAVHAGWGWDDAAAMEDEESDDDEDEDEEDEEDDEDDGDGDK